MNNPMNLLMQMLTNGNNPEGLVKSLMADNPQVSGLINQMNNSGMSQKDFVMQFAKQNNVDIQPLIQMLNNRGFK